MASYSDEVSDGSRCIDTVSELHFLRNQVVKVIEDLEAHSEHLILNEDLSTQDEELATNLIEESIKSAFSMKTYVDQWMTKQECRLAETSLVRTELRLG